MLKTKMSADSCYLTYIDKVLYVHVILHTHTHTEQHCCLPAEQSLSLTVPSSPGISQLLVGVEGRPHFGAIDTAVRNHLSLPVSLIDVSSTRQKQPADGGSLGKKSVN